MSNILPSASICQKRQGGALFHQKSQPRGIRARNMEQQFALELSLRRYQARYLDGVCRNREDALALCGIAKVVDERFYTKRSFRVRLFLRQGYRLSPGDKEDKMRNWMQPIYDNLRLLVSATSNERMLKERSIVSCIQGVAGRLRLRPLPISGEVHTQAVHDRR
jgi:predicted ribonuclease YlaK